MSQNSLYVLFGHGNPLQKGNLIHVPENGTMIKMIPGTCTPMRALKMVEYAIRVPNTPPDELVKILNELVSTKHHPAFRTYEPMSVYSDSRIVIEDAKLYHYDFNDAAKEVSTYDMTDLLLGYLNPNPGHIPLSIVNRYLATRHAPLNYTLVVLACMQIDPATDAAVEDLLSSGQHSIEEVHNMVKDIGYHGGKKSRMIKSSVGKKRRNLKTTHRKKKLSTEKNRKRYRK
jgi:hypothetical protein